jgi:hypothetical protein
MLKSIVFYVFIVGILIFPAYGYDHWNFEGDIGQGWHFEGTPQWHLDCNDSHNGSCSVRSGEILPFSGPTSIPISKLKFSTPLQPNLPTT